MQASDGSFSGRIGWIVFAAAGFLGLCAAVAATPPGPVAEEPDFSVAVPIKTSLGDAATTLRPLGRGPAIRVGRAYGPEDEDCVVAVTQVVDQNGQVHLTRGVACAE